MSYRKPERRQPAEWREFFESVGRMRRHGWQIHTKCPVCDVTLRVPLGLVILVKTENFSLWNRETPCTVEGCTGRRYYEARPPGLWTWITLRAPD